MSRTQYTYIPSFTYKVYSTYTLNGKVRKSVHTYTGDIFDAIESCYKNVIWSGLPDFKIVKVVQKKA